MEFTCQKYLKAFQSSFYCVWVWFLGFLLRGGGGLLFDLGFLCIILLLLLFGWVFLYISRDQRTRKSTYLKYIFINLKQNTEGQTRVDSFSVRTKSCVPLNIKTLSRILIFTPQFFF